MFNRKARKLIGYDEIVSDIAATLEEKDLEYLETDDLKSMLGDTCEKWEFQDLYRLITDIRRRKRASMREENSIDKILGELPYAAQQMAQKVLVTLCEREKRGVLFHFDCLTDGMCEVLWELIYCCIMDIKTAVRKLHQMNISYSKYELDDNKLLRDVLTIMRDSMWYGNGEVLRLRTRPEPVTNKWEVK